ncbi:MAG: winged helix-turn-helix domain-containing protein [Candidatus Hermodarchaeota archaeon]
MKNHPNIEDLKPKIKLGIKFWLEFENKSVLGSGWAELLEIIKKNDGGSLTQAAKECTQKKKEGYSYKYAWNILKRIENRTGLSPVITGKGGLGGGGWVKLNDWGKYLLMTYKKLMTEIEGIEKKLEKSLKIDQYAK